MVCVCITLDDLFGYVKEKSPKSAVLLKRLDYLYDRLVVTNEEPERFHIVNTVSDLRSVIEPEYIEMYDRFMHDYFKWNIKETTDN